jgi:hypothetical protein
MIEIRNVKNRRVWISFALVFGPCSVEVLKWRWRGAQSRIRLFAFMESVLSLFPASRER